MIVNCRACSRVYVRLVIAGVVHSGAACPHCGVNPVPSRGLDALQSSENKPAGDWPGCRD